MGNVHVKDALVTVGSSQFQLVVLVTLVVVRNIFSFLIFDLVLLWSAADTWSYWIWFSPDSNIV